MGEEGIPLIENHWCKVRLIKHKKNRLSYSQNYSATTCLCLRSTSGDLRSLAIPLALGYMGQDLKREKTSSLKLSSKGFQDDPSKLGFYSVVNGDSGEIQVLILGGLTLPDCGQRRPQGTNPDNDGICYVVAPDVHSCPKHHGAALRISVYIQSQAGNTTGVLCSLMTRGIRLKRGCT